MDEVKQRAELPFGHQFSLQSCNDGLVGETSQGGTGSVKLAPPGWEQLRRCDETTDQHNGTVGEGLSS
jgi:hypothetical protein